MFRRLFSSASRQLHVFSKQAIKPAIPTPSHLKRYNLSSLDKYTPRMYIPIIFYYLNNNSSNSTQDIAKMSRLLKSSLSEILIQYYPFAGRLNSTGSYVDCNDEGIEFQEVSFECGLSEILNKPEHEARGLVYPKGGLVSSSLLVIRLNHFECGGISLVVSMSHKLGDARTFLTFISSWAAKMRTIALHSPHFISNPSNDDDAITIQEAPLMKNHGVTRRFVFPNSKIAKLKAMINESGLVQNITRVEALTALLCKSATSINATNSGFFTPSLLVHPVNMRPKLLSPLPETSIGNLYWSIDIPIRNESENNLNILVEKIKKGKMEIGGMKNLDALMYVSKMLEFMQNNYNLFLCSSICRMQFYQVDFGWGNPSRVTLADSVVNNSFILMDTPNGDGIEALVCLDEQNMISFQGEDQILAFQQADG